MTTDKPLKFIPPVERNFGEKCPIKFIGETKTDIVGLNCKRYCQFCLDIINEVVICGYTGKDKFNALIKKLPSIRFLDIKGKDKKFVTKFNNLKTRTIKQKIWYDTFLDRDLSVKLLDNIIESTENEIILKEVGKNIIGIEYVYTVDLKNQNFVVSYGIDTKPLKIYNLNRLPTAKTFIKQLNKIEGKK